jgi:hypothetical protein
MEMAVRSMETVMETDGDGSGGTSPSRQGAGTETSVPRNSLAVAAELRNSSRNFADSPRIFYNIPGFETRKREETIVCIAFMHRKSGHFLRF